MQAGKPTKPHAVLSALQHGDLHLGDYLDQVERHFNAREPQVLAFVPEEGRFNRLREEAEQLQARYPDPGSRPPLFGLLIGVKDIFHADGFPTRAGSQIPPETLWGPQAESVTRLKAAGALVLGKTVTTEFAYFAPGPTRNPHNPEHTPGGSSSGSAAAVAAGLVPLALGTQTIGSVTRPASFCGVLGYKPSYDRISKAGVIPLASSLDHVGLFTSDLALAQSAASILAQDWKGSGSSPAKAVLGVPEGPYLESASPQMLAHFRQTCQRLADSGYEVKPIQTMPDFTEIVERHNTLVAAEAAQVHAAWFEQYGDRYHPKTAELIRRGQTISDGEVAQAIVGRTTLRDHFTALMQQHGIDLWLSPAAPGPAPRGLDSTGDPVMNLPWTHSGLPTLNIPSGADADGLPLGLQLAAGWYQDEMLFAWGRQISKVLD